MIFIAQSQSWKPPDFNLFSRLWRTKITIGEFNFREKFGTKVSEKSPIFFLWCGFGSQEIKKGLKRKGWCLPTLLFFSGMLREKGTFFPPYSLQSFSWKEDLNQKWNIPFSYTTVWSELLAINEFWRLFSNTEILNPGCRFTVIYVRILNYRMKPFVAL